MKTFTKKSIRIVIAFAMMSILSSGVFTSVPRSMGSYASTTCSVTDNEVIKYLFSLGYKVDSLTPADDGTCNRIAIVDGKNTLTVIVSEKGIEGIVVGDDAPGN